MIGCAGLNESKRVVIIPPEDMVLWAGPDMKGHVYFCNKWEGIECVDRELSANKNTIPEGARITWGFESKTVGGDNE